MSLDTLPFDAPLDRYSAQAEELLEGQHSGAGEALTIFHRNHPRFLDDNIKWLPKPLPERAIQETALDLDDARLALARWYCFQDWGALEGYVQSVSDRDSAVFRFEADVEAVVAGDLPGLASSLEANPELVRARSTRVTHFDPPVHRSTLLHYVAANGVEGYRQKTPKNAVAIARCLLEAGAEADALADLYGTQCTTMALLVSSCHPAAAGLQGALVKTLLDFGAALDGLPGAKWGSPLMTALAFGYLDTAETLARRGARVDHITAAAGLGRTAAAAELLPGADAESRHRAMALAAQHGHTDVVRLLLDAGEDPNRYNPEGLHAHSTPLHQAVIAGRDEVVRLLVEWGARLDIEDTIYHGTPLGWALHAGRSEIAEYLRQHGAE